MDMETGCASLHAGLVERARRPNAVQQARSPAPRPQRLDLSAFLVERAAPPARASVTSRAATGAETPCRVATPVTAPAERSPGQPRRALTLRIEQDLHDALQAEKALTGATNQRILHRALTRYLAGRDQRGGTTS